VGAWQLTLPGEKVIDASPDGIWQQAQNELREETGFRAGKLEKLLDFYSHPGYIAHKVYLLVAHGLEWDPLEIGNGEEIRVHTFTWMRRCSDKGRLRCDPEAASALWLYAGNLLRNI
jgi:8-oxo-dGTP pyrophosphatase MutT (NUDIX family)